MKKGFTMIELIIVIIVIGILAGLALPQYTKMIERGQMTRAKSALDMIRKAEGINFTNNSEYMAVDVGGWTDSELTKDVAELAALDGDSDWSYKVELGASTGTFIATATRLKGVYKDTCFVQIDNTGKIYDYDTAIREGNAGSCPAAVAAP